MNDIKAIVAKNITELRQSHKMTQYDLAVKLNYSDKAVSKWERGESLPDVSVLVSIADIFEVPLDYLVREKHPKIEPEKKAPKVQYNRPVITAVSVVLVWLVAFIGFLIISAASPSLAYNYIIFIYAVPVSAIVWLVLNSVWFDKRRNYLIISLLMWSALAAVHFTILACGKYFSIIYLAGIPGQAIILLWSRIKKQKPQECESEK